MEASEQAGGTREQLYPWPAWVTGGWGIALVLNFWDVYMRASITDAEVEREMARLQGRR